MNSPRKVVAITGASQGIGAGLVKAFRDRDYRVIANSRSIKPFSDPDIIAVPGDIAERAVAERMVKEAVERFGRIDTLINNAGIFSAKPFTAFTVDDYVKTLAVNLDGFFHVTQAAIAEMEKQGSGHVVSVTTSITDHAIEGVPSALASLTKGGINAASMPSAAFASMRSLQASSRHPCMPWRRMRHSPRCILSIVWARFSTSFRPFSIWNLPAS
jgi:NAD(P)-dependent dehydrogenase (short-subunit alcohol dehydrogenase family)